MKSNATVVAPQNTVVKIVPNDKGIRESWRMWSAIEPTDGWVFGV